MAMTDPKLLEVSTSNRRRVGLLFLVSSVLVLLPNCSSTGKSKSTSTPGRTFTGIEAASMYADESLHDWTSQSATIVIEGRVTSASPMEAISSDRKVYGHDLTVRVERVLWKSIDEVPDTIRLLGGKSSKKDDGSITDLVETGAYRLQAGDEFVGAIRYDAVSDHAAALQTATSVIHVVNGKLKPVDGAPAYQQSLDGKSVDDLAAQLPR